MFFHFEQQFSFAFFIAQPDATASKHLFPAPHFIYIPSIRAASIIAYVPQFMVKSSLFALFMNTHTRRYFVAFYSSDLGGKILQQNFFQDYELWIEFFMSRRLGKRFLDPKITTKVNWLKFNFTE